MKVVGVIPSRFGAQRFPGKPLVRILGKPLLQWVIEGCQHSKSLNELLVATDNAELAALAHKLGVEAVMTDSSLPSGTDRVWAAIKDRSCDVVVNIQGDEPLVRAEVIDSLVGAFRTDQSLDMATLGRPMDRQSLSSSNTAKIVVDKNNFALYFSRLPIPYSRSDAGQNPQGCLKHIGIYGFRRDFLGEFCRQGVTEIERGEGLEQLRALYLGARIKVVSTEYESWGVDVPDDVAKVESMMRAKGMR